MATQICVQVFAEPLEVVIRSPLHSAPTCDTSPLLIFSTLGPDNVSNDQDAVRVFIDGVEVSVDRVGQPYGFDTYGGYGAFDEDTYGYGYGYGCNPDVDPYGYGYGYGYGLADEGYGADGFAGVLHVFQLPELENGRHTLKLIVKSTSNLTTEVYETFIVDNQGPEITIISPANDTINPVTEVPVLEYQIADLSGISSVNVNIDGIDYGYLSSGTPLDFLVSGLHEITITATDIVTQGGCPLGNQSELTVQFNLLKPIEISEVGGDLFVGVNAITQQESADGIFEEFRVLNAPSTDGAVQEDYQVLRAKIRFQLREGDPLLTPEEALTLQQLGLDGERINLPDNTLLLCHYDTNVNSLPGIGSLEQPESQIIDPAVAGRRVDITVFYVENTFVDRELITDTINRIVPAFVEANIDFEPVPSE